MPPRLTCCDSPAIPAPGSTFSQSSTTSNGKAFFPLLPLCSGVTWVMCSMLFFLPCPSPCLCPWHNPCLAMLDELEWEQTHQHLASLWLPWAGSLPLQGVIGFPSASASLSPQIQQK